MFGIDFSEILVIFGIALVVLGPERLPKLAATIGRWLGRARSMARQFREQLEHEASRLQQETKGVHDSLDLNAAVQRPASQPPPYSAHAPAYPPPSPEGTMPASPAAPPAASTPVDAPAAAAHEPMPHEFGLHNAGATEPASPPQPSPTPATPGHSSGPTEAAHEGAVAVEAHER